MSKQKSMKVYPAEKDLGLEDLILANTSFACVSLLEIATPVDISKFEKSMRAQAGEDVNSIDVLYPLKSIMVSTGKNKNDDVFLKEELWKARHTPEDKPFNYEHKDDVIGHITGNYCIDAEGSVMDDNLSCDDLPDEFHIVTSAVLYKDWKTKENRERMEGLIKDIEKGLRSVSMECILTNFDYMLIENEGTEKAIASIVPRNKNTAYLTKHLRVYKGSGSYDGKSVSRVLRNITFSGKGLVVNPANPKSVILQDPIDVKSSASLVYINESENKESLMADTNTFEKENTELKSKLEKLQASIHENDQKALKAQADKFEAEAKVLSDENTKLKLELENTSKNLKEVSTAKAEYEVKLAKIETEAKTASRINAVATSLNLEPEKAQKIVANLMKLEDGEFDAWVKVQAEYETEKVAAYKTAMEKGGTKATSGDGDPMAKGGAKVMGSKPTEPTPLAVMSTPGANKKFSGEVVNLAKGTKPVNLPAGVTASETVDVAEVNAEEVVLENAEVVKTPALAGSVTNDKVENRRASIAEFFGKKKANKESK